MDLVFRNPKWHRIVQGMMLVLLWPGPIPVAHSHTGGDVSAVEVAQLSRHLAALHRGYSAGQLSSLGWHVHWVVPSVGYTGINAEQLSLQTVRVVPVAASCVEEDVAQSFVVLHELFSVCRADEFVSSRDDLAAELQLDQTSNHFFLTTFSVVRRC